MKSLAKKFFVFLFLIPAFFVLTGNKVFGVNYIQSTLSMKYLQGAKNTIKFDLNEDNTYYVIQTSTENDKVYSSIFGEDALTEENILRFFIFNEKNINMYGRM